MTKIHNIWLIAAIFAALAGLATGTIFYFFGVKVVSGGEAYGFRVGDGRERTFENAQTLLEQNKIVAIHACPEGESHRPFKYKENPKQNIDPRWVMVVDPDWWNNTITITFDQNTVFEIRSDRICCELP